MATSNINRVVLSGNLTHDPELRSTNSGTSVCSLRVAVNQRVKRGDEWVDKPNYFDVTVWGAQGENAARYLARGRGVVLDGRLEWREFTDRDGNRRQTVDVVAETVQFLPGRQDEAQAPQTLDERLDELDAPAPAPTADDDIPF